MWRGRSRSVFVTLFFLKASLRRNELMIPRKRYLGQGRRLRFVDIVGSGIVSIDLDKKCFKIFLFFRKSDLSKWYFCWGFCSVFWSDIYSCPNIKYGPNNFITFYTTPRGGNLSKYCGNIKIYHLVWENTSYLFIINKLIFNSMSSFWLYKNIRIVSFKLSF